MGFTRLSPAVQASPAREPVLGKRGSALGLRGRAGAAGATAVPRGRARNGKLELREPPALSGEASRPCPGRERSRGAAPELPRGFVAGPARDGPGAAPGATPAPRKSTRNAHGGAAVKDGGSRWKTLPRLALLPG